MPGPHHQPPGRTPGARAALPTGAPTHESHRRSTNRHALPASTGSTTGEPLARRFVQQGELPGTLGAARAAAPPVATRPRAPRSAV
eukprot:599045-Prymnesium_polylepis.1